MTVALTSGGITDDRARFRVVSSGSPNDVRVAVADNPGMSGPVFTSAVLPFNGWSAHEITGLDPKTSYWYALEEDSVLDTDLVGKFRTHSVVGEPWSYTIASATCAGSRPMFPGPTSALARERISNHPVFDAIRLADPLLFIHGGDRCYYDFGSGVHVPNAGLSTYRRFYDDVLACTRQHALHRDVPYVYCWDDHDFGGNESNGSFASKANAAAIYRERNPHYDLAEPSGPIYHGFQIGRVQYAVIDSRYHRDPDTDAPPRTYLGAAQLAWLENLIETSDSEFFVWVSPQPPSSGGGTSWGGYGEERDSIWEMFADNGWIGKAITLSGDQHQLGFDTGAHNGGMPLYTLAPMDSKAGIGAFTYDLGYTAHQGAFGTVEVRDNGLRMSVTTRAWLA